MKFTNIEPEMSVFPGEYVLHKPSSTIVLVGAFNRANNIIKVLKDGRLLEDKISNFQKIELTQKEYVEHKKKSCGKCKGGRG
jgi:hypothetical protein